MRPEERFDSFDLPLGDKGSIFDDPLVVSVPPILLGLETLSRTEVESTCNPSGIEGLDLPPVIPVFFL